MNGALLVMGLLLGCPGLKVSQSSWDNYITELGAWTPGQALPPQVDQGTMNLTDTSGGGGGTDVGDMYVWPYGSGGDLTEGFQLSDLPKAAASTGLRYAELSNTADDPIGTPLSESAFDARVKVSGGSPVACKSTDLACMAKDTYRWYTFPTQAPPQPPGNAPYRKIHAVQESYDPSCPSTMSVLGSAGWVYRSRVEVSGQARWVEHWFVREVGVSGKPKYMAPDMCEAGGPNTEYQVKLTTPVTAPTMSTFYNQLKGSGCSATPEPWCGYCATASDCKHTSIELYWNQVQ